MKRINKSLIAFILLILCSGCSINYNIEITTDNVEETITINDTITSNRTKNDILQEYKSWFPAYIEDDSNDAIDYDSSKKIDTLEYHEKTIKELNNGYYYTYKFNYPLDKYTNAIAPREAYSKRKFYIGKDYIILNTDKKNLLCNYSYFEELVITISIDKETYMVDYNNADNIKNDQYIWKINRDNCDNSEIILKLDMIDKENNQQFDENDNLTNNNKSNDTNKYTIYIFFAVIILIIYMVYNWFIKFKEKNNNID